MICFVSGKTEAVDFYTFGDKVTIPLSQYVFARFILRAMADDFHIETMKDLKDLFPIYNEAAQVVRNDAISLEDGCLNPGVGAHQLRVCDLENEWHDLLLKKARSGLRILEEIRNEIEEKDHE